MQFNKISLAKFLGMLSAISLVAMIWLGIFDVLDGPKYWAGLVGFTCLIFFGALSTYTGLGK